VNRGATNVGSASSRAAKPKKKKPEELAVPGAVPGATGAKGATGIGPRDPLDHAEGRLWVVASTPDATPPRSTTAGPQSWTSGLLRGT
jgi:hypothetical protein